MHKSSFYASPGERPVKPEPVAEEVVLPQPAVEPVPTPPVVVPDFIANLPPVVVPTEVPAQEPEAPKEVIETPIVTEQVHEEVVATLEEEDISSTLPNPFMSIGSGVA